MKTLLATIATVLLLGCSSPGRDFVQDLPLEILGALNPLIATQVKPSRDIKVEIAMLRKSQSIGQKIGFGQSSIGQQEQVFEARDDGLLSAVSLESSEIVGAKERSLAKTVSICGLLPVLREVSGGSTSQVATAFPVGRQAVPFGFSSTSQYATRLRMSKLKTSSPSMCSPAPGATFSIQTESELQVRFKGDVMTQNRQVTVFDELTCSVAKDTGRGPLLHPALAGEYLSVTCVGQRSPGGARQSRYAFLLDSGIYVQLEEETAGQTVKFEIAAVEYKSRR